jgi:hypothetical protein
MKLEVSPIGHSPIRRFQKRKQTVRTWGSFLVIQSPSRGTIRTSGGFMKHEDVLKRARLLAQAANEAADAAVSQAQKVDRNSIHPNSPATAPAAVSLPSLKKEKSTSVEKKTKHGTSKHSTDEKRSSADNLLSSVGSLPAINKRMEADVKADEGLNFLTQPNETPPILPVVPSPKDNIDRGEDVGCPAPNEHKEEGDRIGGSTPHTIPPPLDQPLQQALPILQDDQEGDDPEDPVTQYIQEYLKSRAQVVVRKHAPQQVLCYLCCAEFGTASLLIHQKTCWTKQYVIHFILS